MTSPATGNDRTPGQAAYETMMSRAQQLGLLDDDIDAGEVDEPLAWEELEPAERAMFDDVAQAAIACFMAPVFQLSWKHDMVVERIDQG